MKATMSPRQYGTLRYIRASALRKDALRGIHMGTLSSLCQRGWIEKGRDSEGAFYGLSYQGERATEAYYDARFSERAKSGPLTAHAEALLALVRSRRARRAA